MDGASSKENEKSIPKRIYRLYLQLVFLSNWCPVLCTNSCLPVECKVDIGIWKCILHPEAGHEIAWLLWCKCKLTRYHILLMVQLLSIWWCHLEIQIAFEQYISTYQLHLISFLFQRNPRGKGGRQQPPLHSLWEDITALAISADQNMTYTRKNDYRINPPNRPISKFMKAQTYPVSTGNPLRFLHDLAGIQFSSPRPILGQ